ncbi:MAG: translocation/assembly module TamB domain-containing protein [Rickettsiales bacterium]
MGLYKKLRTYGLPAYIALPSYVIIFVVILLMLSLITISIFLSTNYGKSSITHKLEKEIYDATGYFTKIDDISFFPMLSVRAKNILLTDGKTNTIKVNNFSLKLKPLAYKAYLKAKNIIIPANKTKDDNNTGEDIELSLDSDIKWLSGQNLVIFSVDNYISKGASYINNGNLRTTGEYLLNNNILRINSSKFINARIIANNKANIDFNTDKLLATSKIDVNNLEKINDKLSGKININSEIEGSLTSQTIKSKITSKNVIYDKTPIHDFSAIINAKNENEILDGTLNVTNNQNAEIKLVYKVAGNTTSLNDIQVRHGKNSAYGKLTINTDNMLTSGKLTIDMPELKLLSDYLKTPLSGKVNATARLNNDGKKQKADILIKAANIVAGEYGNYRLSSANSAIKFNDVLSYDPDIITLEVNDTSYDDTSIKKASFKLINNKGNWKINSDISGKDRYDFSLNTTANVNTDFKNNKFYGKINSLTASYADAKIIGKEDIIFNILKDKSSVLIPYLIVGKGIAKADIKLDDNSTNATISGKNIYPKDFNPAISPLFAESPINFIITVTDKNNNPEINANINAEKLLISKNSPKSTIKINLKTLSDKTNLKAIISDGSAINSNVALNIPTTFSLTPPKLSVDENKPLNGDAKFTLDTYGISKFLLPPEHILSGKIQGKIAISGTSLKPSLKGNIKLTDGSYNNIPLGINLIDMNSEIVANRQNLAINKFTASDKEKNTINLTGSVNSIFSDKLNYKMDILSDSFTLFNNPDFYAKIAANLKMSGDSSSGKITGKLDNKSIKINLPERFTENPARLNITKTIPTYESTDNTANKHDSVTPSPFNLVMDIIFNADNQVFVRGWGLDTELKGNLKISGDATSPDVKGKLSTVRGRYEEFGKKFSIKKAELVFDGEIPPSPYLNIVTSNKESGVEINPIISGEVSKPELRVESIPPMPQDEALSMLLFGKTPGKITPFQAAQLADSIRKLSGKGGGGFNPVDKARDILGLDDIKFNAGEDDLSSSSIGVGKYIDDNIYLELEQDIQGTGNKAKIEVELTPNISVESGTSSTQDSEVGINWKYDY